MLTFDLQKKVLAFQISMQQNITLQEASDEVDSALEQFYEDGEITSAGYMTSNDPELSAYEIIINGSSLHKIIQWATLKEKCGAKRINDKKVLEWLNTEEGRKYALTAPDFNIAKRMEKEAVLS